MAPERTPLSCLQRRDAQCKGHAHTHETTDTNNNKTALQLRPEGVMNPIQCMCKQLEARHPCCNGQGTAQPAT